MVPGKSLPAFASAPGSWPQTLRIEAGLIFYGYEFTDQTDPFEAGIGFTVPLKSKEDDFIGRDALERLLQLGAILLELGQLHVARLDRLRREVGLVQDALVVRA